jgi:serine protease Do
LSVGDFVLAIGSPLGLSRTVTFGIVSAVGRADVGVADYEDFIQTDAPINPGNSGGALVNIWGELVGINTAIASPTGGSVGVGFAVPSNMARAVMQSLLKTGRVVRGFLGASTQDVTPLLSKVFKLPDVKGAIITDLQAKGSAERAGLRRGDVVVRFDGREILDGGHLRNLIAAAPIGSRHKVEIVRDGRLFNADLAVQEAPRERARKAEAPDLESQRTHPLAGLMVDELTPMMAKQIGAPTNSGIVVTDLEEGSLAEASGMQPGDIILDIDGKKAADGRTAMNQVARTKPGEKISIQVLRNGKHVTLEAEVGLRPPPVPPAQQQQQ